MICPVHNEYRAEGMTFFGTVRVDQVSGRGVPRACPGDPRLDLGGSGTEDRGWS